MPEILTPAPAEFWIILAAVAIAAAAYVAAVLERHALAGTLFFIAACGFVLATVLAVLAVS